jgi:hypothetical protein
VSETLPEPQPPQTQQPPPPVQYTEQGRWLYARRMKIAVGIAVLEGIWAGLAGDVSHVTIFVISVPVIAFYLFAGRTLASDTARQLAWIAAASQVFAILLCVLAILIGKTALIIVGLLAAVGVYLVLTEKPAGGA